MNSQTVSLGKAQIRVLSTVKGLVSEAAVVEEEIESFEPDLVALSIGPEEIEGTRKWDGEPYEMSGWDEVYGLSLRKIVGDDGVKLPPPSFSMAIKISDLKNSIIKTLDINKAQDIISIDLKDKSSMADFMIIASGTSSRHIQSLSEQVLEKFKDNGIKNSKIEGADSSEWKLIDGIDLIVHIFHPEKRKFYELEKMWSELIPKEKLII